MAEYYPLLAKAVASLPNSTPDSRKVIYDRARKALIGQLRTLHPPVPDEDIERESAALDAAVDRLETELAEAPATKAEPEPAVPAAPPPSASFPSTSGALNPSASQPFAPLRTKVPSPKVPQPPAPSGVATTSASGSEPPTPTTSDATVGEAAAVASADVAKAPSALPPASVDERGSKPRVERQRPVAPQPPVPKRAKRPMWIIPAGIGLVVFVVALAAYKLRDRPDVLHSKVAAQAPANAGKSVERVNSPSTPNSATTTAVSDQATPSQTAASATAVSGQPQAAQPSANPAAPVAGRAALLVEAPEEADKFKTYLGTVVWRLDNVSDGQNQAVGLAVRADIDLPDDKLKATVVFQKNVDASLPASHTVKVRFIVSPGSPSGNVKEINVLQMRREDSSTGEPLDGVTVPIVENSFLVGLSPGTAETANLDLLRTREWIDIPIRLSSGKIAKLTFEKTDAGRRDLQEATAAWSKS